MTVLNSVDEYTGVHYNLLSTFVYVQIFPKKNRNRGFLEEAGSQQVPGRKRLGDGMMA